MLIKFHSEESADFVMLDSTANQLLTMMGHGGNTEGSVSGEALASALDLLSSIIAREQDKPASVSPDEQEEVNNWDEDEDSEESKEVTLSARAAPLFAMLRRARDADGYVMWSPE